MSASWLLSEALSLGAEAPLCLLKLLPLVGHVPGVSMCVQIFFFFRVFFFMWTVVIVFIEFVMLLLFYILAFWLQGMWDLSSLTKD